MISFEREREAGGNLSYKPIMYKVDGVRVRIMDNDFSLFINLLFPTLFTFKFITKTCIKPK